MRGTGVSPVLVERNEIQFDLAWTSSRQDRRAACPTHTKKRPHFWGHNPKEARGRKSGIVVEGAAFAEKAAWVEDSAIPKEEDRTHIACGLFS